MDMTVRQIQMEIVQEQALRIGVSLFVLIAFVIYLGWASRRRLRQSPDNMPHRQEMLGGTLWVPITFVGSIIISLGYLVWSWVTVVWPTTTLSLLCVPAFGSFAVIAGVRPWWLAGWTSGPLIWCIERLGDEDAWPLFVVTQQDGLRHFRWSSMLIAALILIMGVIPALRCVPDDRQFMLRYQSEPLTEQLGKHIGSYQVLSVEVALRGRYSDIDTNLVAIETTSNASLERRQSLMESAKRGIEAMRAPGTWEIRVGDPQADHIADVLHVESEAVPLTVSQ